MCRALRPLLTRASAPSAVDQPRARPGAEFAEQGAAIETHRAAIAGQQFVKRCFRTEFRSTLVMARQSP